MITVFLPCRAGSERVPRKNTKPFCGVEGGLLSIKLEQLLKAKLIDQIVVSTNDPEVIKITKKSSHKIIIDERAEFLSNSRTSTDELIKYVPTIITSGHILWTHVTSPFLNETIYDHAIRTYLDNLKNGSYDSLMSVNVLNSFIWNDKGSINYDRNIEKWPRTQTLSPVYEINSGIFINSFENYINYNDRISSNPYLYKTEGFTSFDIDWPADFTLAELIKQSMLS